jgi:hypothetical protein
LDWGVLLLDDEVVVGGVCDSGGFVDSGIFPVLMAGGPEKTQGVGVMNKDFWDVAFGGKDTLRLSIGARNFRIRKNLYSSTATFEYGEGMRIRVKYRKWGTVYSYQVSLNSLERWAPGIINVRLSVQELTGLVLNCFE